MAVAARRAGAAVQVQPRRLRPCRPLLSQMPRRARSKELQPRKGDADDAGQEGESGMSQGQNRRE